MKDTWSKFNIGDLVKVKEYYKRSGSKGIIIDRKRGYIFVFHTDDGEVHLHTPGALDLVSSG